MNWLSNTEISYNQQNQQSSEVKETVEEKQEMDTNHLREDLDKIARLDTTKEIVLSFLVFLIHIVLMAVMYGLVLYAVYQISTIFDTVT